MCQKGKFPGSEKEKSRVRQLQLDTLYTEVTELLLKKVILFFVTILVTLKRGQRVSDDTEFKVNPLSNFNLFFHHLMNCDKY